jgi:hypothetical protein
LEKDPTLIPNNVVEEHDGTKQLSGAGMRRVGAHHKRCRGNLQSNGVDGTTHGVEEVVASPANGFTLHVEVKALVLTTSADVARKAKSSPSGRPIAPPTLTLIVCG